MVNRVCPHNHILQHNHVHVSRYSQRVHDINYELLIRVQTSNVMQREACRKINACTRTRIFFKAVDILPAPGYGNIFDILPS